jgi:hypothetical protein
MHRLRVVLLMLCSILVVSTTSLAQEPARLALLIGNQGYSAKVGPLRNPQNDVTLVGSALSQIGFQVTILRDADYRAMDTAIKRFVDEVNSKGKGAISFFYYSGHGAANPKSQINYLIPIDIDDPNDGNLWYHSFQQNDVIDKLSKQAPDATHYVVFDACRNELNLSGPTAKAIGAEKGFVAVQQTPGLLIAYATAQGKTAADTGNEGGPYARALAAELVKPGVEAVNMFRNVQIRVKEDVGQDPWLSFPSLPKIYFAGEPTPESQKADVDRLIQRIRIGRSNAPGIEAMKKICKEAITGTASLASTINEKDYSNYEKRFWELYFGPMNLIEIRQSTDKYFGDSKDIVSSRIESAMVVFGRALKEKALAAGPLPHAILSMPSSDIRNECEAYLH